MPAIDALPRPASEELQEKLALVLPQLWRYTDVWVDRVREDRSIYPQWLVMQHALVRAAVPLMSVARDEAARLAPDDSIATALVPYFEMLIKEERGHDEWLLEDLWEIGWNTRLALDQIPSSKIAALVGSQYYWMLHFHPVALLGYIEIMEGYPPRQSLVDALLEATGYPRSAFRTLERHGTLDIAHREYLHDALDGLNLGESHRTVVGVSALATVDRLIAVNAAFLQPGTPASERPKEV